MNLLLTIDQKNFILSVVILTLVFILVLLVISDNFSRFKKRLDNGKFEKYYLKELSSRHIKVDDYRDTKYVYKNTRNLTIDGSRVRPEDKEPRKVEVEEVYLLEKKKKKLKKRTARKVGSAIVTLIICGFIGLAIYQHCAQKLTTVNGCTYVTVVTGSMAETHPSSESYLKDIEDKNQIKQFTLIKLHEVKEEDDLKLFSIYGYKDDHGKLIIHRLVHKELIDGKYRYVFKGDANSKNDTKYVDFNQILYEYRGEGSHALGLITGFSRSYIGFISLVYILIGLSIIDVYESKKDKLYLEELDKYIARWNKKQYLKLGKYRVVQI